MKKGFTLMELLVYMAIVGIIVLIAGQAFSDSTKFRVRSQNMLKATQEAENVASLFKADVSQMGAKSTLTSVYDCVYIDKTCGSASSGSSSSGAVSSASDFSSFRLASSNSNSDLIFRRLRYDNDGHYQAVEEINWFVENKTLKRSCRTIAGTEDSDVCEEETAEDAKDNAVVIATGVEKFRVIAPTPGVLENQIQVFPPEGAGGAFKLISRSGESPYAEMNVVSVNGTKQTLSNFHSNYNVGTEAIVSEENRSINQLFAIKNETVSETNWRNLCTAYGGSATNVPLSLDPDNEYELSFSIPYIENKTRLFVPGIDHMSVGFRDITTGEVPQKTLESGENVKLLDDFFFVPAMDTKGGGKRIMRFTVPERIENVCIAFTFAFYSPLASQAIFDIENLQLKKLPYSNYDFAHPLNTETTANKIEKKNIKALKLELTIARGGKSGEKGETGEVDIIVPTPSNGPRD
jgi:prepilin-type N-terminal cleavage/methylation domain-containing protein